MSISDLKTLRKAVIERVLEGDGKASNAQRRAAFDNSRLATPLSILIDKVAKYSYKAGAKFLLKRGYR